MTCTNCGCEIPEGDLFCCGCGQRVPESVPVEEFPEAAMNDVYLEEPAEILSEQPKKKGLKLWLLLGSIGVTLAALIVVLIVILTANGPASAVYNGVQNVLNEKTFTVHIEGNVENDAVEVDMQVDLDLENRDLSMICVYTEDDNDPDMTAIYDGYLIWSSYEYTQYYDADNDYWYYEEGDVSYRAQDISDELEIFFDAYERLEDGDASLQEMVETLIDDIGDSYLEESYEEIEDHVNMEVLEDCLKTYFEMLNDESWLEEHANFTTEKDGDMDIYILEPDLYDFTMDSVEYFRDAFEDEDDYDELEKLLKSEAKEELKRVDAEITLGIEDDMLVYGTIEGEAYDDPYELTIEITDIGETEVDKDMLEDILDEAEIW